MQSHSDGGIWGLDVDPSDPSRIVTSGDDNKIMIWDAS